MPWTAHFYPVAMRHLPMTVRDKAIAIANALLAEGYPEGQAIRIAIAQAKRWAQHHGATADERRSAAPSPARSISG